MSERSGASVDTEVMLIERLRAQDPSVLEILMERYSPRIYRVAFGITRSHGDAEEFLVAFDATIASLDG